MPMAAARACRPGCPSRITAGHPCPAHERKRWAGQPSRHQRGYGGGWDRRRRQVLIAAGGVFEGPRLVGNAVCGYCGNQTARTVDHRKAKAEGGTDDLTNLVACCQDCQKRKAGREGSRGQARARRAVGMLAILLFLVSCSASDAGDKAKRPTLTMRAYPRVSFAPATVRASVRLIDAGEGTNFICPWIAWEWGDGCRSTNESDCDPFVLQHQQPTEVRFSDDHVYRSAGEYRLEARVTGWNKASLVAARTIVVRGFAEGEE